MTKRQRALHLRLREESPSLYQAVQRELAGLPVGTSARVRIPARFEMGRLAFDGPTVLVSSTPRGLEYVEDGMQYYRKGWTRPRPRLLPMLSGRRP